MKDERSDKWTRLSTRRYDEDLDTDARGASAVPVIDDGHPSAEDMVQVMLTLDDLRWSYELSIVPGPDTVQ